MKSKLIASLFAAVFTITLTVVALVWKFSKLPDEKNLVAQSWWAPSPYEWRVLGKLDTTFSPEFHRIDVPSLYSPIKIKSYIGNEPYYGAIDQIRSWMIGDLSQNRSELWRALISSEAEANVPAHPATFKEALVTGFGGASDDCSNLKVERAFRFRNLDPTFFEPAMAYLESCKTERGVVLLSRIAHALAANSDTHDTGAPPSADVAVLIAQLKQVQAEIDRKSLLAAAVDNDLKQIEASK